MRAADRFDQQDLFGSPGVTLYGAPAESTRPPETQ